MRKLSPCRSGKISKIQEMKRRVKNSMYSMLEDTICICVSLYLHKETLKRNMRNTQGCRAGEGKDISLILLYVALFFQNLC